jgi:hypothetical protein
MNRNYITPQSRKMVGSFDCRCKKTPYVEHILFVMLDTPQKEYDTRAVITYVSFVCVNRYAVGLTIMLIFMPNQLDAERTISMSTDIIGSV